MIEIVIASDTHGRVEFINTLQRKHPNAYLYLHAGDSCLDPNELYPFQTVKGKCDYLVRNPIRQMNVYGLSILMFHGDKFMLDKDMFVYYANNYHANIIIHGHTHIPYYDVIDGIVVICPGSIYLPRVTRGTYALMRFDETKTTIEEKLKSVKVEIINYDNR